jgi:hypothetical protein
MQLGLDEHLRFFAPQIYTVVLDNENIVLTKYVLSAADIRH